jgi:hypothetical protein
MACAELRKQARLRSAEPLDDGTDAPQWNTADYVPLAKPGHRAPHFLFADGTPLYDRLGAGFAEVRAARREESGEVLDGDVDPDRIKAYLAKYDEAIRTQLNMTPEQLRAQFSTTLRITPSRVRSW